MARDILQKMFSSLYNLKHGLYFDSFGYRLAKFPTTIHIELTNACNLKCPYCPRTTAMKRSIGFMDNRLFRAVIDEGMGLGLRQIHLCMFGEPLLHPEAASFIEYAKSSGVKEVGVGTNGTLLTPDLSKRLIEARADVLHICIDGASKDTYEKMRKGAGYDSVIANVESLVGLIKRKEAKYPYIFLNIIEAKNTKNELACFIKKWEEALRGIRHSRSYVKRYTTFAGQAPSSPSDEIEKSAGCGNFKFPCINLRNGIGVYWNGDVTACCYDADNNLKAGSLKDSTLRQIWSSEYLSRLRLLHAAARWGELAFCRGCEATRYNFTPHNLKMSIAGFLRESRDRVFRKLK